MTACLKEYYTILFPVECMGFNSAPEVTAKVLKRGYKIYEVPISYGPRGKEKGKKLRWNVGLKAICTLIKYRFL